MIDRSYLPFQSAREYQDRGMMKWMGFFLSEHTTSLDEEKHKVKFSDELSLLDKMSLISQLYAGQLMAQLMIKKDNQKITVIGEIRELSSKGISVKTSDGYTVVQLDDIQQIHLLEEEAHE